jgi:hypothetical protein
MTDEVWHIDENTPGQGPRPDWLKPKYKSMSDQAKAYNDAEKRLGGMQGAPEEYDLGERKELFGTNPMIQDYLSFAKQSQLTQDVVGKSLEVFEGIQKSFTVNEVAELEKLGADGQRMHEVVNQWVNNTFSNSAQEAFSKMPKTAEMIKLMDEARQMQAKYRSNSPNPSAGAVPFKPLTLQDVKQEMEANYARYSTDPAYRKEIQNKFAQAAG